MKSKLLMCFLFLSAFAIQKVWAQAVISNQHTNEPDFVPSGAPIGQEAKAIAEGESEVVGEEGASAEVSAVSVKEEGALLIYTFGRAGGDFIEDENFPADVSLRFHPVWGVGHVKSAEGEITIDYSNLAVAEEAENLVMLKRTTPLSGWQDVSGEWEWNATVGTVSRSGVTGDAEYAIGGNEQTVNVEKVSEVPRELQLKQNYPNPFNPATTITYQLPEGSQVELGIYDMVGRHVTTLVDQRQQAGSHQVIWDASDMASGTYIYRLEVDGQVKASRAMSLLE